MMAVPLCGVGSSVGSLDRIYRGIVNLTDALSRFRNRNSRHLRHRLIEVSSISGVLSEISSGEALPHASFSHQRAFSGQVPKGYGAANCKPNELGMHLPT